MLQTNALKGKDLEGVLTALNLLEGRPEGSTVSNMPQVVENIIKQAR